MNEPRPFPGDSRLGETIEPDDSIDLPEISGRAQFVLAVVTFVAMCLGFVIWG